MNIFEIGKLAKESSKDVRKISEKNKNRLLKLVAQSLVDHKDEIIKTNQIDIQNAEKNNMNKTLIDRLILNENRILMMADGLLKIMELDDPIGKILETNTRPNGLVINKRVVPLGVIGIIFESRPNVTVDAFGLCFKTNNSVILRGGKEAVYSNTKLVEIIREVFSKENINPNIVQVLSDTSRETANEMMKMNQYIDVLIPRGGAGLISAVVNNSTIPVIETGVGNCHVYVDKFADIKSAVDIAFNAKVQRPGVCNSCETILVHKDVASEFLPLISKRFEGIVEVRGDESTLKFIDYGVKATEEDYYKEYLDLIVSMKVVDSFEEAINHIDKYSTGHSEAIITKDYDRSQEFLNVVDSAAVYVNASTRFTDGVEFGYGAEIGISTQKLHARGPMGLNELTTIKYVIQGSGQLRK